MSDEQEAQQAIELQANSVALVSSEPSIIQPPTNTQNHKRLDAILFSTRNILISRKFINLSVVFGVVIGLLWLILYIFADKNALPGGIAFSLWILFAVGHLVGFLCRKIKIPGLLGLLLVGILAANISYTGLANITLDSTISTIIRRLALCVILCKAGLSVNPKVLLRLKFQILKLSTIPCLTEAVSFSIVAKYILNIPLEWSFLLGFAVTGVSPAVIIPFMYDLQERKFGTEKGIPTMIMASASFDNVIALTGNAVLVGIVFGQGELWWNLVNFPIQILVGILFGIIIGFLLNFIRLPHKISVSTLRISILLAVSIIVLFGSQNLGYSSVGPLAILSLAFVAKLFWTYVDAHENENHTNEVSRHANNIWFIIFEPLLFTSIGNQIKFSQLEPRIIGLGVAAILIGMVFRLLATFLSVSWAKFSLKEKIFICLAWLPKATVQAAVGSLALDLAMAQDNNENVTYGRIVSI